MSREQHAHAVIVDNRDGSTELSSGRGTSVQAAESNALFHAQAECRARNRFEAGDRFVALSVAAIRRIKGGQL